MNTQVLEQNHAESHVEQDLAVGFPRTLLVFHAPLVGTGVGNYVMSEIRDLLPKEHLYFAHLMGKKTPSCENDTSSDFAATLEVPRRYEHQQLRRYGRLTNLWNYWHHRIRFVGHVRKQSRKVIDFAKQHRVERVFLVAASPTAIEMAAHLKRALDVPLKLLVWDDVGHLCQQHGVNRWISERLERRFAHALSVAERTGVCGESMQQEYNELVGEKQIVLRHGLEHRYWMSSETERADDPDKPLIIGYGGSISAPLAFEAFISMLDSVQWRIAGRPVILRITGGSIDFRTKVGCRIDYVGFRDMAETISLLSECDLLYLPQPFRKSLEPLARLSFPNKLSTYLAAGRPILLHAPSYGSLISFFDEFPCGPICTSQEQGDLLAAVTTLTKRTERIAAVESVRRARESRVNYEKFRSAVHELLEVTAAEGSEMLKPRT